VLQEQNRLVWSYREVQGSS